MLRNEAMDEYGKAQKLVPLVWADSKPVGGDTVWVQELPEAVHL